MTGRCVAVALSVVVAAGCRDVPFPAAEVLVWEPEELAGGGAPPLDDATSVEVTVVIEDRITNRSFGPGEDIVLTDLETPPEGSEMQVRVETTAEAGDDAFGQTATFTISPDAVAPEVLVLAPVRRAHTLIADLPNRRTHPAVCTSVDGDIYVLGGVQGNTLVPGSFAVARADRAVREGPGLPRARQQFGCALDGDRMFLAGGCDGDGTALRGFEVSASASAAAPFAVGGETLQTTKNTCGAALATGGGDVFVQYDDVLERRDPDGALLTSVPLSTSRYYADVVAVGGIAYVAGGSLALDGLTRAPGTARLDEDGSLTELAGSGPLAKAGAEVFQVSNTGSVIRLHPENVTVINAADADVPAAFDAARAVKVAEQDNVFAVLNAAGDRVYLISANGTVTMAFPGGQERPFGHLVAGRGGALFVVGGNQPGVLVIRPEAG